MRSIFELSTEEAYRLVSEHFGHRLPSLDAVENEDWGRIMCCNTSNCTRRRNWRPLGLHGMRLWTERVLQKTHRPRPFGCLLLFVFPSARTMQ